MKKSFIIHNDSLAVLDDLTLEQCGELFQAIRYYQSGDEELELSPIVKVAFSPFKNQFDRDEIKYQNIVDRNRNNGLKGGRPKKPVEPSGISGNPVEPKKADSDSKSKNDSDSKTIVIPDGINHDAWNEWIAYRKSKKKKVSQKAATKQFKLLSNYAFDVQQQIIDQSIQNDYQGLFEPKGGDNGRAQGHEGNQRPNQTGRPSVVDRVKRTAENRERDRSGEISREGDGQALDQVNGDLRPQAAQPIRGDDTGGLGNALEGDFTRAD